MLEQLATAVPLTLAEVNVIFSDRQCPSFQMVPVLPVSNEKVGACFLFFVHKQIQHSTGCGPDRDADTTQTPDFERVPSFVLVRQRATMASTTAIVHEEPTQDMTRKRYGFFGKNETAEERCHRMCRSYQGHFRDVPAVSSVDFCKTSETRTNVILVDVRSPPERSVSMISGAISLEEFENNTVSNMSSEASVVTYCTIGYRSGMEGRRLRNRYGLQGRVSSLDGIVAYSHALSSLEDDSDGDSSVPRVTDPSTGNETKEIHTFAGMWDCVSEDYNAQQFSPPMLVLRLLQVGGLVVLRTFQRLFYNVRQCCLPTKRD